MQNTENNNLMLLSNESDYTVFDKQTESTLAEEDTLASISISPNAFLQSLPVMGKGMLGIFLVTLVIILAITVLNKLGERAAARKKAAENGTLNDNEADEGNFE